MKTIKLLQDTRVQLEKGASVTVSEYEAWRLIAFGLAEETGAVKAETKKTATTKKTTSTK